MKYYILKRKGFFTSEAPHMDIDWCGSTRRSHFNYEVTVVCPDKGQAIVIYHEDIAERIGSPIGTCENMAKQICKIVETLLIQNEVLYNLVHVRIQPHIIEGTPVASMQYVSAKSVSDMKLIALV